MNSFMQKPKIKPEDRTTDVLSNATMSCVMVPVKNFEQGKLACNLLKSHTGEQLTAIHLYHCVEDQLTYNNCYLALEVIRIADEQSEKLEVARRYLSRLAQEFKSDFPDCRVSYHAAVEDYVWDGIVQEANMVQATMILLVDDHLPEKRRWFLPGISSRILHIAKCPVQIVKPGEKQTASKIRILTN